MSRIALIVLALLAIVAPAVYPQTQYTAQLSGANEVPPNNSFGSGSGNLILSADQTTLSYNLSWTLQGIYTASHIHRAVAGMNGGVIHPLQNAGSTGANGAWALTAQNVIQLNSDSLYVNVHSNIWPGGEIRGQIMRVPPQPCPCPNPEQEPNDEFPVTQSINMGEEYCGVISHPNDFDFVKLNQNVATAIRVTLLGNAGPGPCPGGQGLHPSACILPEDASEVDEIVIAFAGDTTNQSTYFESTFELGPYPHIIEVSGANGTTGPYILRVDPIDLPTMAPPAPRLTLHTQGGQTLLHWNASYLPGESLVIEHSATPDGPWFTFAVIFGGPPNIPIPTGSDRRFFRAHSEGERPLSPFIGAVIPVSEPGGNEYDDNEVGQFQIQEIEWGRDAQGNVGMTRLLAQGVGPSIGEYIDQDNRNLYQEGYMPVVDFAGAKLNVFGREVQVEHCAFVREENGSIGIIDGRGTNPAGDSLMYFSDSQQYLTPEFGSNLTGNWVGWFWWDPCPSFCCRLKVIAFCRSTFLSWAPACFSPGVCPGNPACYLGCPCEPMGFLCTTPPPGCSPCTFVPDPNFALKRWCMCQFDTPPPPVPKCFFLIFVKCKFYECQDLFQDCICPGAPPCPTFPVWTVVPFVNSAMRAACRVDCFP